MAFNTPGVYVEEINDLTVTVSPSTTAVPVFVVGSAASESWWEAVKKPLRINSFMEYERYENDFTHFASGIVEKELGNNFFSARQNGLSPISWPTFTTVAQKNKRTKVSKAQGINWGKHFPAALLAYFQNGGGYCYICPQDMLAEFIPGMRDVTLVVQAGEASAAAAIQAVCLPGSGLFGLLDGPQSLLNEDSYSAMTPSDNCAVFYPWLKAGWNLTDREGNKIPQDEISHVSPSAVVAGIICTVDRERGVWKAPANVAVKGALRPLFKVGNSTQDKYTSPNKIAVNMLREFEGRGVQVWGARTMSVSGTDWLHIPVRRLFDSMERNIQAALESVVFEPNGPVTWEAVRSAIYNYLYNLWRQGALQGRTPDSSFRVNIGLGTTMTQADIEAGILRVNVQVSAVRPAEYIVLEFKQQINVG
ncbi:phage tail sheath family protein [Enterobacter bugandensis]|uniref:phage tail sheath family protein n=1 Tax=Enterobacter bugandensis TaxID=881260 RepID=UPI002FD200D5